jgi:hypothetical protein
MGWWARFALPTLLYWLRMKAPRRLTRIFARALQMIDLIRF